MATTARDDGAAGYPRRESDAQAAAMQHWSAGREVRGGGRAVCAEGDQGARFARSRPPPPSFPRTRPALVVPRLHTLTRAPAAQPCSTPSRVARRRRRPATRASTLSPSLDLDFDRGRPSAHAAPCSLTTTTTTCDEASALHARLGTSRFARPLTVLLLAGAALTRRARAVRSPYRVQALIVFSARRHARRRRHRRFDRSLDAAWSGSPVLVVAAARLDLALRHLGEPRPRLATPEAASFVRQVGQVVALALAKRTRPKRTRSTVFLALWSSSYSPPVVLQGHQLS